VGDTEGLGAGDTEGDTGILEVCDGFGAAEDERGIGGSTAGTCRPRWCFFRTVAELG
jgi:hypothetical protein